MRRPGFTGSADPSKRAGHACDPSEGEEQLDGGVLNQLRREPLHAPGVAGVLTIQHLGPAKRHGSRIADGHRVLGGGWDAMTPSLSAGRRQGRPGLDRSLDSPILGEDSVKSRSPECVAEPMGVFCVARTASMWATPHPVTTRPLPFARQGVSGPDQSMAPLGTRLRMGSVSVRWERTGKNGEERGRTGKNGEERGRSAVAETFPPDRGGTCHGGSPPVPQEHSGRRHHQHGRNLSLGPYQGASPRHDRAQRCCVGRHRA